MEKDIAKYLKEHLSIKVSDTGDGGIQVELQLDGITISEDSFWMSLNTGGSE